MMSANRTTAVYNNKCQRCGTHHAFLAEDGICGDCRTELNKQDFDTKNLNKARHQAVLAFVERVKVSFPEEDTEEMWSNGDVVDKLDQEASKFSEEGKI